MEPRISRGSKVSNGRVTVVEFGSDAGGFGGQSGGDRFRPTRGGGFEPRFLAKSTMAREAQDAAIGATKTALLEMGRKHGREVRLVHPAYSTMDCRMYGAGAEHRLLLSERAYRCEDCGHASPRDKNSAHVMLNGAGFALLVSTA